MKFLFLVCSLLFSSFAQGSFIQGRIVEITRETPVFSQASKKSKKIATAPEKTLLLLERISPRKLWVQIKDVDGNKGWVPKNRSDLLLSPPRPFQNIPTQKKTSFTSNNFSSKKESPEKSLHTHQGTKEKKPSPKHIFSPFGRLSFKADNVAQNSYGLAYSLLSPSLFNPHSEKLEQFGLQIGALVDQKNHKNLLFPLRLFMSFQKPASSFFSRAETGLLWELSQNGSHFVSLSIGYALGLRFSKDLALQLRPGLELFTKTRFSLEFSLSLYI